MNCVIVIMNCFSANTFATLIVFYRNFAAV